MRVGVSARLAKQALAGLGGIAVADIEEVWHSQQPPYGDLFAWLEKRSERPTADAPGRFRPVMLAQAIDEESDFARYHAADYAAEWKWDGIRVQAVNERGQRRLYSRTGEDIAAAFPDVIAALDFDGVIDGELLIFNDGHAAPFGDLQQRLNRKTADAKLLAKFPAGIRAYDLLLEGESDLRQLPFRGKTKETGSACCAAEQSPHRSFAAAALRKLGRSWRSCGADPPPGDPAHRGRPDAQALGFHL